MSQDYHGLPEEIARIRQDLDEKHRQNRRDIHSIRNGQQEMAFKLVSMESDMKPLLDNGQPGLISRISARLEQMSEVITEIRIAQGTSDGEKLEHNLNWQWKRDALTALIIGVIIAITNHFWK